MDTSLYMYPELQEFFVVKSESTSTYDDGSKSEESKNSQPSDGSDLSAMEGKDASTLATKQLRIKQELIENEGWNSTTTPYSKTKTDCDVVVLDLKTEWEELYSDYGLVSDDVKVKSESVDQENIVCPNPQPDNSTENGQVYEDIPPVKHLKVESVANEHHTATSDHSQTLTTVQTPPEIQPYDWTQEDDYNFTTANILSGLIDTNISAAPVVTTSHEVYRPENVYYDTSSCTTTNTAGTNMVNSTMLPVQYTYQQEPLADDDIQVISASYVHNRHHNNPGIRELLTVTASMTDHIVGGLAGNPEVDYKRKLQVNPPPTGNISTHFNYYHPEVAATAGFQLQNNYLLTSPVFENNLCEASRSALRSAQYQRMTNHFTPPKGPPLETDFVDGRRHAKKPRCRRQVLEKLTDLNSKSVTTASSSVQFHRVQPTVGQMPGYASSGECNSEVYCYRPYTDNPGPGFPMVELCEGRMWQELNAAGTEMEVTPDGCAMTPVISVKFRGLRPSSQYTVSLLFYAVGESLWSYCNGLWEETRYVGKPSCISRFDHPRGVNSGKQWMPYPVTFKDVKLTDNLWNKTGIYLELWRLYQPLVMLQDIQLPSPFVFHIPILQFFASPVIQSPSVYFTKQQYIATRPTKSIVTREEGSKRRGRKRRCTTDSQPLRPSATQTDNRQPNGYHTYQ